MSLDFLEEKTLSTLTVEWTVDPGFAHEIQKMNYDVFECGHTWVNAVVRSCTQTACTSVLGSSTHSITLLVCLDLGALKTFSQVRAIIGAGPREFSHWGVISCVVNSAPTQ